jgi:uncharacterized RDD family membrane protein YckC
VIRIRAAAALEAIVGPRRPRLLLEHVLPQGSSPRCSAPTSWRRVRGPTLALKAWQLRVVRPDGAGVDPRRALARFALAGLALGSGLVAALWLWRHPGSVAGWLAILPAAADLAWAVGDRDRQFLHDRLSGTQVVRIDA